MYFDKHIKIYHPELKSLRKGYFFNYFTGHKTYFYTLSCTVLASFAAYEISRIKNSCYIVESCSHAVAFDGLDTWDLHCGFVIRNYSYPMDDFSSDKIEFLFGEDKRKERVNVYYSEENLSLARQNRLNIKKVQG
jgi:hypothetical protein